MLLAKRSNNRCDISSTFGPDIVDFLTIKGSRGTFNKYGAINLEIVNGKSLHKMFLDHDDILKR